MATLALSVAGQFVGGMVGGPIGATIGRALGGLAGNAIDQKVFGSGGTKAAPSDIRVTGAHEGTAIPRLWGWARVAGNIIWATDLQVLRNGSRGSKGSSDQQEDVIATSFALALCEGEISHIGRVWADGNLLDTQSLNMRVYTGSQTQNADPMIERVQNAKVPAYRGLAYIVFEQMPLNDFGKRIPNLTVEVCRAIGDLERSIEAICITPGSTEFGYDPKPLVRIVGFGASQTENAHMYGGRSDWEVSLDQLQALCPNLKHVSLVVSWFGTDLNCADCKVEPRVENNTKLVRARNGLPVLWQIDGVNRIFAHSVSAHNGASAYGGSPNDASVIAAIKDLRARGLKVTLNPFISMDIGVGNQLVDPQTGALGQGAYPWRGRIMPSHSSALSVSAQVAAFVGNGYRQMILHYARVSRTAGGVDAMLIGSEMRGMTAARDGSGKFPFVVALKSLAADVRTIVGAQTKLTYGADWSEYWGMKPEGENGDICYHLDPLWADENIDAIGIDNYLPISDAADTYDISVLRAGIQSGEHYDYFYANASDRLNGIRTPIADGAYGEPWVWRAKDLVSWWSSPHHDRIGGIKSSEPSPWIPKSKPIWFTELGCGAVDRGSDAPNAFGDDKSIENALPHGSTGAPDALIQRQFLKSHFNHWADQQSNPQSPLYHGAMVDAARLYIWNWDARPFPAFPSQQDVWADAENYQTGHWLNGRLGQADVADLIFAMAADFKVPVSQVDTVLPLVSGLVIEAQTSMRDAIAAVLEMTNLKVVAGVGGLRFTRPNTDGTICISADELVASEGAIWTIRRQDYAELIGDVSVNFYDIGQDYQVSSVSVQSGDVTMSHHVQGGLVLDEANALLGAETALHTLSQGQHIYSFTLPPSLSAIETADEIKVSEGNNAHRLIIDSLKMTTSLQVEASQFWPLTATNALRKSTYSTQTDNKQPVDPVFFMAPIWAAEQGLNLIVGAAHTPWAEPIYFRVNTEIGELAALTKPGIIGVVRQVLAQTQSDCWLKDECTKLIVDLAQGHIASVTQGERATQMIIEGENGRHERLSFTHAELLADGTYEVSGFERGLGGSRQVHIVPDAKFMILNDAVHPQILSENLIGQNLTTHYFTDRHDLEGRRVNCFIAENIAAPLAPIHLNINHNHNHDGFLISWQAQLSDDSGEWMYAEAEYGADFSHFNLNVKSGNTVIRNAQIGAESWVYIREDWEQDRLQYGDEIAIEIAMVSRKFGPGDVLRRIL